MKHLFITVVAFLATLSAEGQTLPVYLDDSKPTEQRIDDALSRMTLQEKIRVLHAQSKFSAAGVPRLGFPDLWTDDGPHGVPVLDACDNWFVWNKPGAQNWLKVVAYDAAGNTSRDNAALGTV